jgi:hypothetical protein
MKPHTLHRLRQQFQIDKPNKEDSKVIKKQRRAAVVLVEKAEAFAKRTNRSKRRKGNGGDAETLWRAWYQKCGAQWDQVEDIEAELKEMRS